MTRTDSRYQEARDARQRRAHIARREDRATTYQLRTLAGLPVRVATVRALEL